jgi:hypothetical protein
MQPYCKHNSAKTASTMLLKQDSATIWAMDSHKRGPKTSLQELFVQRLMEEMGDMSDNELARRSRGAISQTMISAIKRYHHDPSLEKVDAIAAALGVPSWFLVIERDQVPQRVISPPVNKPLQTKVLELPRPYPKIFGKKSHSANGNQKFKKMPTKK